MGGEQLPTQKWEATPASVKRALLNLSEPVKQLSERLAAAEEKLNQHLSNSSRPPSSDGLGAELPPSEAPVPGQAETSSPGAPVGRRRAL